MDLRAPTLVVVMGVSGCGKSTLGRVLADKLGWPFLDADGCHPPENVAHMAAGRPLTDAMREPWLQALERELRYFLLRGRNCVLAFSGLRTAHRQRIRAVGFNPLFIHLQGPPVLIAQRLSQRRGHFMPVGLLASQLAAWQEPGPGENVLVFDATGAVSELAADMADAVTCFLAARDPRCGAHDSRQEHKT